MASITARNHDIATAALTRVAAELERQGLDPRDIGAVMICAGAAIMVSADGHGGHAACTLTDTLTLVVRKGARVAVPTGTVVQ